MSKVFLLQSRPQGVPTVDNFQLAEVTLPVVHEGQVLVKSLFISVDPYMRGRMNAGKSYIAPFEVGKPITGGVVAQVIESKSDHLKEGDCVMGFLPWQEEIVVDQEKVQRIDVDHISPSLYLGLLGLTGLTAYMGYTKIGKAKAAETIVISAAAGAVGNVVGQLAALDGCRVIGLAGTEDKRRFLTETLKFDCALDYHDIDQLRKDLAEAAPLGVDIYFDNVGGAVSDCVMEFINHHARIIVCGQISQYNNTEVPKGPYPQFQILKNSALMQGFIASDFQDEQGEAIKKLKSLFTQHQLRDVQTVEIGFDNLPEAFLKLFKGDNVGKMVVQV